MFDPNLKATENEVPEATTPGTQVAGTEEQTTTDEGGEATAAE